MGVGGFFKKAAPWISGILGVAGTATGLAPLKLAAQAMSAVTGKDIPPDAKAIEDALQSLPPEKYVELREKDAEIGLEMQKLRIESVEELERIAAADRADARGMAVKTGDVWTPRILAFLVVIAWAVVQFYLLTAVVDASMRELVARLLGTLDAALMAVLYFYFGSSASSRQKDEAISKIATQD